MRLLFVVLLVAADAPRVAVQVYPSVFFKDSTFRVTCKVPRDERNRLVVMGVENLSESRIALDGENARITHEILLRADCGVGPAFCELHATGERMRRVQAEFVTSGCDHIEDTSSPARVR